MSTSFIEGFHLDQTLLLGIVDGQFKLDPAELEAIQNLSIDFHLTGDSVSKRFSNALTVSVSGKNNPKRVSLKIDLEILKK